MAANFNVGSFNKIKTDDTNDTKNVDDASKSSSSSHKNDDGFKKRIMIFVMIVIGIVLVLFLVVFLLSFFTNRNLSYSEIEDVMTNAAVSYFEDHPNRLPESTTQRVEIDVDTLVAEEYMKDLTTYTGEEVSCSGKVSVKMNGDDYLYIPELECGDDYQTQALKDVLTKNVVTNGYGLYQVGNSYVFRGEDVRNYLQLDQSLWRIVKITETGDFVLILEDEVTPSVPWDDRYNSTVGYSIGINDYAASRIKDTLEDLYHSKDEESMILSDNDRSRLVPFDLCIGKRDEASTAVDNSLECNSTLPDQNIGLLTASDYMVASIDPNCTTITNRACQNYNYLAADYEWWLITGLSNSTSNVFGVDRIGVGTSEAASSYMAPRAVVVLDGDALYQSGRGTLNKPYKIK